MAIYLRLDGGYSDYFKSARLSVRLEDGPFSGLLDASPLGLARRTHPINFRFRTRHRLAASGPDGAQWKLGLQGAIGARLLFAGNAFLGNFRVPKGSFAIQWDVEGSAEPGAQLKSSPLALSFNSGTRVHQSWVEFFDSEISLRDALKATWRHFPNPFVPESIQAMREGQVVRMGWTGRAGLSLEARWGIEAGWKLPVDIPAATLRMGGEVAAGVRAWVDLDVEGRFQLQLRRKGADLRLNLRRYRQRKAGAGGRVGLTLGDSIRVSRLGPLRPPPVAWLSQQLARPALLKVNRQLRRAAVRKLELAISFEATRAVRRRQIFRAVWKDSGSVDFPREYAGLLRGRIPPPRQGLEVRGFFQRVRERQLTIGFNVLNWLRLSRTTRETQFEEVTVTPAGDLTLEKGERLEITRRRWDEVQFLRLLKETAASAPADFLRPSTLPPKIVWTYGEEGKFGREELSGLLNLGLRFGLLAEYDLPSVSAFPLRAGVTMATRFTRAGLEKVRTSSPDQVWRALDETLTRVYPRRYGSDSFWRDWIETEEVRRLIDSDPLQSHLQSRYPIPHRTLFQRQQVVASYQRASRFLRLMRAWRQDKTRNIHRLFRTGLEVPIFFLFHSLCPARNRRSAVAVTGDLRRLWGEESLISQP